MNKPLPPDYQFCPMCGIKLEIKKEENLDRKFCPNDKWTYYPRVTTSAGALIVQDGNVLLVQRAREPYKGTWMIPSGFCNFAEHPRDAVIREVPEETGYKVLSAELFDYMQAVDDPREPFHNLFIYTCTVEKGGDITDVEENTAIDWFPLYSLPEIGWITNKKLFEKLIR
ncbi:MAG: NUDIX domain-containing protein [bacterium]|nr:NUDIX domain-containing protein [bacterium]